MSQLSILHRDAALVAVSKPAGLLVHRTALDAHEESFALQLVRDAIGQRVWPVHRLDKGTSGALAFALSHEVASALGTAFGVGAVEKRYIALVRGWPRTEGVIEHRLVRRLDQAEARPAAVQMTEPQPATTRYVRLGIIELNGAVDRFPTSRYALVALAPLSGRRHQLRRHLKHIAHPIIGDATYGKGRHNRFVGDLIGMHRLWLHALSLGFAHPVTGERLVIEAPLGEEWLRLMRLGEWHWDTPWRIDRAGPRQPGSSLPRAGSADPVG